MNKQKIMRDAERALKRTTPYQDSRIWDENYKIEYVLAKGNRNTLDDVIASATCDDEILSFNPYDNDPFLRPQPFYEFCYVFVK